MKIFMRIIALMLMLTLFCPAALAQAPAAIPLREIATAQVEPPPEIQKVLDIAYAEWIETDGKNLTDKNKFTEWRGKGYKFQWCGGYVTWCMLEADIPMMTLAEFNKAKKADGGQLKPIDGVYHCKEALPSKILAAYQYMDRVTAVPQKGFLIVYGTGWNETVHTALVYDVEELGGGKFRITTLEGNVKNGKNSNSITMYVRDYDMNAEVNIKAKKSSNLTAVPENERTVEGAEYILMEGRPNNGYDSQRYYVYCFLMPWVPGDPTLSTPAPTATPVPTPEPTPAPTAAPAPVQTEDEAENAVMATLVALTPPPANLPVSDPAAEQTAAPAAEPTAEPAAEQTVEPVAAQTAEPESVQETFACTGKAGACRYGTLGADDPFCRFCDWNDNGVEDSKE